MRHVLLNLCFTCESTESTIVGVHCIMFESNNYCVSGVCRYNDELKPREPYLSSYQPSASQLLTFLEFEV